MRIDLGAIAAAAVRKRNFTLDGVGRKKRWKMASDNPIPVVPNLGAPDIFADGAFGAFVTNGNIHITLVSRRCDYSINPNSLSDVVIGRLVMPLTAAEKMVQFLGNCLESVKRQGSLTASVSGRLQ
jgi:hypothetical protein